MIVRQSICSPFPNNKKGFRHAQAAAIAGAEFYLPEPGRRGCIPRQHLPESRPRPVLVRLRRQLAEGRARSEQCLLRGQQADADLYPWLAERLDAKEEPRNLQP